MNRPGNGEPAPSDHKFGTFGGVFTPCTLTILGVIMFLRLSEVVGQSGFLNALIIVLLAKVITVLTGFSLSAVATNTRVKAGGAYYLISRSLGVEFGGVIGTFFFFAQAVSVSMYVIGFTEAFQNAFPSLGWSATAIATVTNVATFVCVYVGAGWTIRLQYGILAVLLLAIVSFFAGILPDVSLATLKRGMQPAYEPGENFFTMFALFFPAVTGIMAGANMSGDLRDPRRAIPGGTLASIAFTAVVYLAMVAALAAGRTQEALTGDAFVVKEAAWSGGLIVAGVFAATLSSALGSMMGAPRILQAFARDDIFRPLRFFAKGAGAANEPRRAVCLTFAIAQAGILLGDLDAIAPIITMFFMITYGTLNLACFYESRSSNPSYRPTFRFNHWSAALLGAVGCLAVMFLINALWACIALVAMVGLYRFIERAEIESRWGDVASGVAFERARQALLRLERERYHPKNWRPTILALSGGAWSRFHLAEYAHWLASSHGVLTLAQIITGDVEDRLERRAQAEKLLRKYISEEELEAFPAVIVEAGLNEAIKSLLQSHGIGGIRPNTVLLGMSREESRWAEYCRTLRFARDLGRSLAVVYSKEGGERWTPPPGSIDILWQGHKHGDLLVLLAHMLGENPEWRDRPMRLLATLPAKGDSENYRRELREVLGLARLDARLHVFESEDLFQTLAKRTGNTALLFLGFDPPTEEKEAEFLGWTNQLGRLTPDIILVCNAGGVSLEA